MAIQITNITDEPRQRHVILARDEEITLTLSFYQTSELWAFDISWRGETFYGFMLSLGVLHIRALNWPFDFFVSVTDGSGMAPFRQGDFAEGRAELYFVTAEEMQEIRGLAVPGTPVALTDDAKAIAELQARMKIAEEDIRTLDLNLRNIASATALPGFLNEFLVTTANYPYLAAQNVNFRLQRLNATTLRALTTGPVYQPTGGWPSPQEFGVIVHPQVDIPLSSVDVGLSDGQFFRYVGVNRDGSIVFSETSLAREIETVQLGLIIIKRVAGVQSFQDEVTPVRTQPNLAGVSNTLRLAAPLTCTVAASPNGANLNMSLAAGELAGECINWGSATPHSLFRAATPITSFFRLSPGAAMATTLGAAVTAIDPVNYWNGSALVNLGSASNASVQRVLISAFGGVVIQYGEAQYTSLADAKDAIDYAPFTEIFPATFFVEIARVAVTRSATALNNNTQAIWHRTGDR